MHISQISATGWIIKIIISFFRILPLQNSGTISANRFRIVIAGVTVITRAKLLFGILCINKRFGKHLYFTTENTSPYNGVLDRNVFLTPNEINTVFQTLQYLLLVLGITFAAKMKLTKEFLQGELTSYYQ